MRDIPIYKGNDLRSVRGCTSARLGAGDGLRTGNASR